MCPILCHTLRLKKSIPASILSFSSSKEKPPQPIFGQQINLIILILFRCSSLAIIDVCISFTISLKIQLAIFEMQNREMKFFSKTRYAKFENSMRKKYAKHENLFLRLEKKRSLDRGSSFPRDITLGCPEITRSLDLVVNTVSSAEFSISVSVLFMLIFFSFPLTRGGDATYRLQSAFPQIDHGFVLLHFLRLRILFFLIFFFLCFSLSSAEFGIRRKKDGNEQCTISISFKVSNIFIKQSIFLFTCINYSICLIILIHLCIFHPHLSLRNSSFNISNIFRLLRKIHSSFVHNFSISLSNVS